MTSSGIWSHNKCHLVWKLKSLGCTMLNMTGSHSLPSSLKLLISIQADFSWKIPISIQMEFGKFRKASFNSRNDVSSDEVPFILYLNLCISSSIPWEGGGDAYFQISSSNENPLETKIIWLDGIWGLCTIDQLKFDSH